MLNLLALLFGSILAESSHNQSSDKVYSGYGGYGGYDGYGGYGGYSGYGGYRGNRGYGGYGGYRNYRRDLSQQQSSSSTMGTDMGDMTSGMGTMSPSATGSNMGTQMGEMQSGMGTMNPLASAPVIDLGTFVLESPKDTGSPHSGNQANVGQSQDQTTCGGAAVDSATLLIISSPQVQSCVHNARLSGSGVERCNSMVSAVRKSMKQ